MKSRLLLSGFILLVGLLLAAIAMPLAAKPSPMCFGAPDVCPFPATATVMPSPTPALPPYGTDVQVTVVNLPGRFVGYVCRRPTYPSLLYRCWRVAQTLPGGEILYYGYTLPGYVSTGTDPFTVSV